MCPEKFNPEPAGEKCGLDTSFDSDGIFTHDGANGESNKLEEGYGATLDGQGRLTIAGFGYNALGGTQRLLLWRLTSTGALDTTFDTDGFTSYIGGVSGGASAGYSPKCIAVDSSDRIIVVGTVGLAAIDMAVWRFTSTGQLDSTFSEDGVFTHHNAGGGNGDDGALGVSLLSDGGLLVSGYSYAPNGFMDLVIWKLTGSGALDTSFGAGKGYVTFNNNSGNSHDLQ